MKKLRLDIEEVSVDSFRTEEGDASPGTVLGREEPASRSVVCGSCPVWSCPSPCP